MDRETKFELQLATPDHLLCCNTALYANIWMALVTCLRKVPFTIMKHDSFLTLAGENDNFQAAVQADVWAVIFYTRQFFIFLKIRHALIITLH